MTDVLKDAGSVDHPSPRARARRLQQASVVGVDAAYLGEVERGRANISVLTLSSRSVMARYRPVDVQPKFVAIDLAAPLLPGTVEQALHHLLEQAIDLTPFDARHRQ